MMLCQKKKTKQNQKKQNNPQGDIKTEPCTIYILCKYPD